MNQQLKQKLVAILFTNKISNDSNGEKVLEDNFKPRAGLAYQIQDDLSIPRY